MELKPYIIAEKNSIEDLVDFINDHIEKGYIPHGSIAVDEHGYFMQPMILPSLFDKAADKEKKKYVCKICGKRFELGIDMMACCQAAKLERSTATL